MKYSLHHVIFVQPINKGIEKQNISEYVVSKPINGKEIKAHVNFNLQILHLQKELELRTEK